MLGRLFLAITVFSLVELFLLVKLAQLTSFGVTLAVVLLTAAIGAWLLRREGGRTFRRVQTDLAAGRLPGDALVDGLAVGIAGAFLLTPGVLSDVAGILLLLPAVRVLLKALLLVRFQRFLESGNVRVVTMGASTTGMGGFGGFGGANGPAGFGFGDGPSAYRGNVGLDGVIDGDALEAEQNGQPKP